MNKFKNIIICLTISIWAVSCSTVPGTGRSQFAPIPDSQLLSMSVSQYNDVLKKSKIITGTKETAMVRTVGLRIARAVEDLLREENIEMEFEWEFNLIKDDKQVNAWCMPGGKIAVYTGILPVTQDETGLAVVMGHEVAHAVARHGNERMTQGLGVTLAGLILAVSLNEHDPGTRNLFLGAFGAGAQYGILLPFGRSQESEADRIGLQLMARAGYDPHAAIPFWQRMGAKSKGSPPEYLSTHPSSETRIKDIKTYLPEAMIHYFPDRNRRP